MWDIGSTFGGTGPSEVKLHMSKILPSAQTWHISPISPINNDKLTQIDDLAEITTISFYALVSHTITISTLVFVLARSKLVFNNRGFEVLQNNICINLFLK